MAKSKLSVGDRIHWIKESTALRALNALALSLMALGGVVLVVCLVWAYIGEVETLPYATVGAYVGGVMLGVGIQIGILALAVNAIVSAIARAALDTDLGAGSPDRPRGYLDQHGYGTA